MRTIYFDYNATTPLDAAVREAMLPWLGERFGNPSSGHEFGTAARKAVNRAREQIAAEPASPSPTAEPVAPVGPARFSWPVRGEILARFGMCAAMGFHQGREGESLRRLDQPQAQTGQGV